MNSGLSLSLGLPMLLGKCQSGLSANDHEMRIYVPMEGLLVVRSTSRLNV